MSRLPQEPSTVAAVNAARDQVVRALGLVAAQPLDQDGAAEMRRTLRAVHSPKVKAAIRAGGAAPAQRRLRVIGKQSGSAALPAPDPPRACWPQLELMAVIGGAA